MRLPDTIPAGNVYAGTLGGTALSVFGNIMAADVVKTAVLAAVGAAVSFGVSVGLKALFNRGERRKGEGRKGEGRKGCSD